MMMIIIISISEFDHKSVIFGGRERERKRREGRERMERGSREIE